MNISYIFRYIFLYVCVSLTFCISTFIISALQCLLYVSIAPFSKQFWRKINYYFCTIIFYQITFILQWYSGSTISLYMDKNDHETYFGKEHVYLISNHFYEIDWMLIIALGTSVNCDIKVVAKDTIKYIPGIGMVMYFADCIFLSRSFDKDKYNLNKYMDTLVSYLHPIWLYLLPEGTRFTPEKHEQSVKYATEKNLPIYKYHLCPRTKGFVEILPKLKKEKFALYDITISFNPTDTKPTLINVLMGKKVECHMFLNRIPFAEIPTDKNEATNFLFDIFSKKDELQENFFTTGKYFTNTPDNIICYKIQKSITILISTIACLIISLFLVLYFVNSLLSGDAFLKIAIGIILIFLCKYFNLTVTI